MSANESKKSVSAPNWMFLSTTGPTLDSASVKAMRAHTTKVNFTRRRLRLVREYTEHKQGVVRVQHSPVKDGGDCYDGGQLGRNPGVEVSLPLLNDPDQDRQLSRKDLFFFSHCAYM